MIHHPPVRSRKEWGALLVMVLAAAIGACSVPRDPIIIEEGLLTVENQTSREWRNVRVTINHHFSGGVATLAPGGRLNAPLSQFQTAYGQKFDRGRQSVFKVDVTATDPDGKPVTLTWGEDQRR
jgi:hypothetical protein